MSNLFRAVGRIIGIILLPALATASEIPVNTIWPRPMILPMPITDDGEGNAVISLDGQWKINPAPPANYWGNDVDPSAWKNVNVPGPVTWQNVFPTGGRGGFGNRGTTGTPGTRPTTRGGFRGGQQARKYAYKTKISIPADFAGKRIFLRFEGVTGTAQLWVNGASVAQHVGGFTVWNPDITDHVIAGQDAWLTVGVTEPQQNSATETYDGGIIRNVSLIAVPKDHFTRFNIETDLDRDYRDATLKVWVAGDLSEDVSISLSLKDSAGNVIPLNPGQIDLTPQKSETIADIPVANPLKWNAEQPNLYTLEARLLVNGKTVETISKHVGFRKIEIHGRTLLVNGQPVKLRGAGSFDSDAISGRTLRPGEAERDVLLYKAGNMNYARPATYPATQEFLDAADKYGLYIEGECPVNFSRTTRDETLTPIYLSQASEMIETDRSHPSILMWDLSNETSYGVNIQRESDYIHAEDKTRPVIFSWSNSVPRGQALPYEIYSYHYPNFDENMGLPGVAVFNNRGIPGARPIPPIMPVLSDEFAHPPCYDSAELQLDPNVHNFWGESIRMFWEHIATTEGALGGGIWGFDDDPMNAMGRVYGWGLVDVWRRPKPEYWLAKKAYSPIRIDDKPLASPGAGKTIQIPIKNWFDFTNLKEVTVNWKVGSESGSMPGPDVAAHGDGILEIPPRAWKSGDILNLRFLDAAGGLIDEFNLPVDPPVFVLAGPSGPTPAVADGADAITIGGKDFSIIFSKQTGMIERGIYKNDTLIEDGPTLHVLGAEMGDWSLKNISAKSDGNEAVVNIIGSYGNVDVSFEVRIDGTGLIVTKYTLDKFPITPPATTVLPWNNSNAGGFEEVGVSYLLSGDVDALDWSRKGLWSAYPDDHIGRNVGLAHRTGPGSAGKVGVEPTWPWAEDEKDFNQFGPNDSGGAGTNDFRSMKEYIYHAAAIDSGAKVCVRAESSATDAVRLEVVTPGAGNEVRMFINNQWNYRFLGNGNYMKPPVIVGDGYSNSVRIRLTDSN